MIEKVVNKCKLDELSCNKDLAYWLSRTPEDRILAVEALRQQHYGLSLKSQKIVRVIRRKKLFNK